MLSELKNYKIFVRTEYHCRSLLFRIFFKKQFIIIYKKIKDIINTNVVYFIFDPFNKKNIIHPRSSGASCILFVWSLISVYEYVAIGCNKYYSYTILYTKRKFDLLTCLPKVSVWVERRLRHPWKGIRSIT